MYQPRFVVCFLTFFWVMMLASSIRAEPPKDFNYQIKVKVIGKIESRMPEEKRKWFIIITKGDAQFTLYPATDDLTKQLEKLDGKIVEMEGEAMVGRSFIGDAPRTPMIQSFTVTSVREVTK